METQEKNARAHNAMIKARSRLVLEHPFFGSLALRLTFKPDPSCRHLWTDGKTLAFNPVYAAMLPQDKLLAAQAHEIMHVVCGHNFRRKGRDEKLWNQACDYAINQILLDAGFSLPQGFLRDPRYSRMAVDDIFAALSALEEHDDKKGAKKNNAMQNADSGEASPGNPEPGSGGREAESPKSGNSKQENESGGQSRKAKGGEASSKEKSKGGKTEIEKAVQFDGEVRDHPALKSDMDQQAQRLAEQEASIALTQAMQRALHMGLLPAGLERLVRRNTSPALNWRYLLARFLENCTDNDYSWAAPNRRYIHQDIYLPSRREPRIRHVVLAIDASGSIDEKALAVFCSELSQILEAYDTLLTVLFHDTKIQSAQSFSRMDLPLDLVPRGGGGTDYRPVGDYITEHHLDPSCILWFTDQQCNRYPEEPGCPVLWINLIEPAEKPPFGDLVTMFGQ